MNCVTGFFFFFFVTFQFSKESGHLVEECKLRVVYVAPPRPPSPVREGSEEGSSPRASISDNGVPNSVDFSITVSIFVDLYVKFSQGS